jgi:hypothetical protein
MVSSKLIRVAGLMVACWAAAGTAQADSVSATFATPSIDRWMYVFNQSPGLETEARVFSPFPYDFGYFDNRDGQFLVAWDTGSAQLPIGLPLNHYRILSATVTARVSGNNYFQYDPTYDSYLTYLPSPPLPTPPNAVPDSDAGRPIEMFVCGYRAGYVAGPTAPAGSQVFGQTSPYATGTSFPSVERRNVFPAQYNAQGVLIDVSNNVDNQFEARPIAVGQTRTNPDQPTLVAPGDFVPANTDMVFDIDLGKKEALDAIRQGLAGGRVELLITSLSLTTQGSAIVPRFYTRQWVVQNGPDPTAHPVSLALRVCVGSPADWNCSGALEVQDIFDFLSDWFAGNGDFNADGTVSVQDIFDFLGAWFAG